MKKWEKRLFLNDIRKAIDKYDLIKNGDKILIGISGGKDSMLLFYSLNILKKYGIYNFDVHGILIDNGYIKDLENLKKYYKDLNYSFEIYKEKDILDFSRDDVNCYTCARLRKGTLSRLAKKDGFNVIALGHTKDDLVETFLMNLIEKGKLEGFKIKSEFDDGSLTLIRPLIYLDEKNILKASKIIGYPILASKCPLDGKTKRASYEETMLYIEDRYPKFKDMVIKAIN